MAERRKRSAGRRTPSRVRDHAPDPNGALWQNGLRGSFYHHQPPLPKPRVPHVPLYEDEPIAQQPDPQGPRSPVLLRDIHANLQHLRRAARHKKPADEETRDPEKVLEELHRLKKKEAEQNKQMAQLKKVIKMLTLERSMPPPPPPDVQSVHSESDGSTQPIEHVHHRSRRRRRRRSVSPQDGERFREELDVISQEISQLLGCVRESSARRRRGSTRKLTPSTPTPAPIPPPAPVPLPAPSSTSSTSSASMIRPSHLEDAVFNAPPSPAGRPDTSCVSPYTTPPMSRRPKATPAPAPGVAPAPSVPSSPEWLRKGSSVPPSRADPVPTVTPTQPPPPPPAPGSPDLIARRISPVPNIPHAALNASPGSVRGNLPPPPWESETGYYATYPAAQYGARPTPGEWSRVIQ